MEAVSAFVHLRRTWDESDGVLSTKLAGLEDVGSNSRHGYDV